MRDARDCLGRAQAMERRAHDCATPRLRAEMLSMAEAWRRTALVALWQEGFDTTRPAG